MFALIYDLCTSDRGLFAIDTVANGLVALSYLSIPFSMIWVFRTRKVDLPYPALWIAFVLFIFACATTHLVHVASAYYGLPLLAWHAGPETLTAIISILTAIALNLALPEINKLPSPGEQRRALERAVQEATKEKDALLRELNHRVGNNLAKLGAAVRLEKRAGTHKEESLERLILLLDELGKEHHRLSSLDYSDNQAAHSFITDLAGGGSLPQDTRSSPQAASLSDLIVRATITPSIDQLYVIDPPSCADIVLTTSLLP